ncbi:putative uridylyltransferase [Clostridiales bacterium CHKCI001]|nr:putative uridylyltransferase [Clostridiales bacterium CHKCI001]
MTYEQIKDILTKHNQLHLLKYYDELTVKQQTSLLEQISSINWHLLELVQNRQDTEAVKGKLEPLGALEVSEIEKHKEEFTQIGIKALKAQKVGAVLLAGGQGTRLGFDKPKGMFNVGITKDLYIFECLINNLMDVVNQIDTWVPLYIMTSDKNHEDTVHFFEEKHYFGYNKDFIRFFKQDMAPSVDFNGKLLMEDKDRLSLSPNGNGGWFHSLQNAGLISHMKELGIEWLTVFAVDNVLQRINDPAYVGAVIASKCDCGGKVVRKADPQERVGVLCLEDGKPSIVEYYEMTDDMIHLRDENGNLLYNFGVILNYMFRLDKLEEIVNKELPVHIVEKKIPYMDETGAFIKPSKPNGYKFEELVLDMIHLMDTCLPYEVIRNREFAPIKNPTGVDSVESARALLQENGVTL